MPLSTEFIVFMVVVLHHVQEAGGKENKKLNFSTSDRWKLLCCTNFLPCTLLQAYTAYLTGMLRFEHQEWKAAMEAFNKCK